MMAANTLPKNTELGDNKMTNKLALTVLDPGTTFPHSYEWEDYFAQALNGFRGYEVVLDPGKVRGLALAYLEALENLSSMVHERVDMMKSIGTLVVENSQLRDQLNPAFKVNDEVISISTGAQGTIQFIEPGGDRIWVWDGETEEPVLKYARDLRHT